MSLPAARGWKAGVPLLLIVTALLAGVAALLMGMLSSFPDVQDRTAVPGRTSASAPLASRVLMIIVGSLRRDVAQDSSLMPRLTAARRRGSGGILQTSPIPISSAFVWAPATGHPFTPFALRGMQ